MGKLPQGFVRVVFEVLVPCEREGSQVDPVDYEPAACEIVKAVPSFYVKQSETEYLATPLKPTPISDSIAGRGYRVFDDQ